MNLGKNRVAAATSKPGGAMSQTFEDIQKRARKDSHFFASLLLNPERAMKETKMVLEDPIEIKKLEFLVRTGQENLKAAAHLVDVELGTAAWGIGCHCCNGRLLLPGDPGELPRERFPR
jgi:hypothetical protein